MLELGGGGLLAEFGLERFGDVAFVGSDLPGGLLGVEAVDDEQVAVGVVERGEGGDADGVVERRDVGGLVVVELVPGDVPAGVVFGDALIEIERAEVVVDGMQAGHERDVGAGDGEDEVRVVGVGVDDALDGLCGGFELVGGVAHEVELKERIGDDDRERDSGDED